MQSRKLFLFLVVGVLVCLLVIFSFLAKKGLSPETPRENVTLFDEMYSTGTVGIGEETFFVWVADTHQRRVQGLSGVTHLPENTGMLFLFESEGDHGIWMRDMHFYLDIVWLDESGRVVDMRTSVSPDTFPEVFVPKKEGLYVLEVAGGAMRRHGIEVGDTLEMNL